MNRTVISGVAAVLLVLCCGMACSVASKGADSKAAENPVCVAAANEKCPPAEVRELYDQFLDEKSQIARLKANNGSWREIQSKTWMIQGMASDIGMSTPPGYRFDEDKRKYIALTTPAAPAVK